MSRFDRALTALTVPRRRIGASVFRILLGSTIVLFYLQNIGWRRFLWGPQGLVPLSFARQIVASHGPNLYLLSSSPAVFEAVFWLGLCSALAFACGRCLPLSTIACAAFTWCLIARDGFAADAGWNLATILLFYAVVLDSGRYFAAGKWLAPPSRAVAHTGASRARSLLHNFGVALVLWQITLLYGVACFYKITGHKWQDGTALYYILRSNQFDLTPAGALIYHSAILVALFTYGTIVLQAAFPFCIWQRPAKYVVAAGAIGFHIGIAYTMALPFFSLIMIACEALLFSDNEYRAAFAALRDLALRYTAGRAGDLLANPARAAVPVCSGVE
jgi:hypothetical protein